MSLTPPLTLHQHLPVHNTCHAHLHLHSIIAYLLSRRSPTHKKCHSSLHLHSISTYLSSTRVTHTSTYTPSALTCPQHMSLTPPLTLHQHLPVHNMCHSHLHLHSIIAYLPSKRSPTHKKYHSHLHLHSISTYLPSTSTRVTHTSTYTPS